MAKRRFRMPSDKDTQWPEVRLGRRKFTDDPLRQMPEAAAESTHHETERYLPISSIKERLREQAAEYRREADDFQGADRERSLIAANVVDCVTEIAFPDTKGESTDE
jgi:hypothetical protein